VTTVSSVVDPVEFCRILWPHYHLYDRQREIMYSVRDNHDTVVVAGNMLGKDFISALIMLWFFLSRSPCRVVSTSVDGTQLEAVLWGEVRKFIQEAAYPLNTENGGPLVVNHLHLRKLVGGRVCGLSYCIGRVAARSEGLLGHHVADIGDGIPKTLFIADECSGVADMSWDRADTWARRRLAIGNPYEGAGLFFKKAVQEGDVPVPEGEQVVR
jgi:hypothetical protein